MAQMLTIWRRHQKACPHRSRRERRCKCPVWVAGSLGDIQVKQSLDTRSWDAAVGIVRDWEVTGRIMTDEPEKQIELRAACQRFTADAEARGLARSTIKKYRVLFDQLQEFAKDKGLRFVHQLSLECLRLFRESWRESNISALKKLERLRSACGFFVASGWIPENYAKAIRAPKCTEPPTMPFTQEQIADLLGAIPTMSGEDLMRQRMHALILVLRYSGLRIGDAVRLHESRVIGRRIRLHTAKTGTHIDVPVPQFLIDRLVDLPRTKGFYFVTGEGSASTNAGNFRRSFRKLSKLANVENAHPHRFRDTFAVSLLQEGVPIEDVSALLGHRDVRITQKHYAPWVKSRQDALERSVERALMRESEPGVNVIEIPRRMA
jgi:site-specific recombinase XerD